MFKVALSVLACALLVAADVSQLPPIPADLSTPVQIRVAFNGAHGMTIGWNTYQKIDKPTVHWGGVPGALVRTSSSASSVTYPTSRTWSNTVHIAPLVPGTTYYYKIDSTNSTIGHFSTALPAGDLTPYTVAAVIDMGVFGPDGLSERTTAYNGAKITNALAPGEHTTIERLIADAPNYNFIIHPGDFAYADAWLKEQVLTYINGSVSDGPSIYEGMNEQFWQQLSKVSSFKPYMVTAGNHEANCLNGGYKTYTESICPVGQTEFTGFINRFGNLLPATNQTVYSKRDILLDFPQGDPVFERKARAAKRAAALGQSLPPFFYSFDYGMTHYVMFDTETDFGNGLIGSDETGGIGGSTESMQGTYENQQVDWLAADLSGVNRTLTPWVVAAGHRPWYVSGGCTNCQTAFEGLLNKYNVDIVVHGHVHNMQLIPPIKNGVVDPAGYNNPSSPMYIVNGAAGHFEGLDALGTLPSYTTWGNDQYYGYSKIGFQDKNTAVIQFIASNTGAVIHQQTLVRNH
ncbi:putative acid phosphatase [Meredithblackwellia eburnea MCA 4105]